MHHSGSNTPSISQQSTLRKLRLDKRAFNVVKTDKYKVAYIPCPKCACTTLKQAIYQWEYGKPFESYSLPDGSKGHIHTFYHQKQYQYLDLELFKDYFKFIVIRDPIKRFISAYSNRVGFHKQLSERIIGVEGETKLKQAGLMFEPEINYLVEHLEQYAEISADLRHHIKQQAHFIGPNLDIFDFVCKMEDLHVLANKLSKIIRVEVAFPKLQTGGPKISESQLSSVSRAKLIDFYSVDYDLLCDFYTVA